MIYVNIDDNDGYGEGGTIIQFRTYRKRNIVPRLATNGAKMVIIL